MGGDRTMPTGRATRLTAKRTNPIPRVRARPPDAVARVRVRHRGRLVSREAEGARPMRHRTDIPQVGRVVGTRTAVVQDLRRVYQYEILDAGGELRPRA